MKISIVTLGCAKNQVEMETFSSHLDSKGFTLTSDIASAQAIILHTCGFLKSGREEALSYVSELRKIAPTAQMIMTGCYAQYLKGEKPKGVDLTIGTGELSRLPTLLKELTAKKVLSSKMSYCAHPSGYHNASVDRPLYPGQLSSYLRIAEGCSHRCSFCLIPELRGNHKSRSEKEILKEATGLVQRGIKEISLISQDTTYYGQDLSSPKKFSGLVQKLLKIKKLDWLKILYAYPSEIDDELISLLANESRLCRYIDIPLQHISDSTLKRMGRKWGKSKTLELIEKLVSKIPDCSLRTTFIVGFPGETERDFRELLEIVENGYFEHAGVFVYSDESKSRSFMLRGKLPFKTAQERSQILIDAQSRVMEKRFRNRIGKKVNILAEKNPAGEWTARASFQAPEVDGSVILKKWPKKVGIYSAKITGFKGIDLPAELF